MTAQGSRRVSTTSTKLARRQFLTRGAGLTAAAYAGLARAARAGESVYRVGVIGHTGHGDYGHGMDRVWLDVPGTKIVAVADPEEAGRAAAVRRLGEPAGFADYRRMLDEVKPDLVSVCPRWLDQHCDMVIASAERGVRGIYMEKPMCRSLVEADRMTAACEKNGVKLSIAFQTRHSQKMPVIRELIESGAIGRVLEFRARGKEDRRGGGEDLWVLGTHMFNLIHHLGGAPHWCFATVEQDGHPITRDDVHAGAEGIGPLAGDSVHAMYRLEGGATASFDSTKDAGGSPTRFGLQITGSKGIIQMFNTGHIPDTYLLPDSSWSPGRSGKKWIPITSAGVGSPEPLENEGLHGGNVLAVRDLIASIEEDRQPLTGVHEARTATEMIVGVFESQRQGGPVAFPLENRENPLTMLD